MATYPGQVQPAAEHAGGWSTGGLIESAKRPQSDGAVTVEVDGLADDVQKLAAIVSHLEDRLELGLTPSQPRPSEVGMDDLSPDASPLARRIHEIRQHVQRVQERGNEITNRVQL